VAARTMIPRRVATAGNDRQDEIRVCPKISDNEWAFTPLVADPGRTGRDLGGKSEAVRGCKR